MGKTKTCAKCKKDVALTGFYVNKGNAGGRDEWCKDCVAKHVIDESSLHEYCHFNKREFSSELYEMSIKSAEVYIREDDSYAKAKPDKRRQLFNAAILRFYFMKMNVAQFYKFAGEDLKAPEFDGFGEDIVIQPYASAVEDLNILYSPTWNGTYSANQITKLETYYQRLVEDFDLSDAFIEYTYREIAKIALERDEALDDYRRTKNPDSFKRYKDLSDMHMKMSDSAKLSATKRDKTVGAGFGDLGSIIKRIEEVGALMRTVEFEKDDVDIVVGDFYHTLKSFDGENLDA